MLMMSIRTATTRLNVRSLSSAPVPTTPSKSFDEKREFKDGTFTNWVGYLKATVVLKLYHDLRTTK